MNGGTAIPLCVPTPSVKWGDANRPRTACDGRGLDTEGGTSMRDKRTARDLALFSIKYEINDNGCWLWTAHINASGYGETGKKGMPMAHRLGYTLLVGPIPEGMTLDHLCRVRRCVNPAHMEPVTLRENIMRGDTIAARNAAKTHCKRGHEFTPENTYKAGATGRGCRECQRGRQEAYDRRDREAGPPADAHGKRSTYNRFGCRCDECRAANARYRRQQAETMRQVLA